MCISSCSDNHLLVTKVHRKCIAHKLPESQHESNETELAGTHSNRQTNKQIEKQVIHIEPKQETRLCRWTLMCNISANFIIYLFCMNLQFTGIVSKYISN